MTDRPAPTASTPCSVPDPCADGDLCDRHETEQAHAAGDHAFCGVTCEVELPSEKLRNFVLAKGYPGTAGALDELLRRAGQPAVPVPDAERRARYEAAFGPNMRLGLQDAELYDEPGAQRINEWITWITTAVMAVADAEQSELRAQLAAAQQITPATYQTCGVCGAGYQHGQPCQSCAFQAQMAAARAEGSDR